LHTLCIFVQFVNRSADPPRGGARCRTTVRLGAQPQHSRSHAVSGRRLYRVGGRGAMLSAGRASHGGRTAGTDPSHRLPRDPLPGAAGAAGRRCREQLPAGDGAGYLEGAGFHSTLERMHGRGWRVEILSWAHSTNQRMRRWAEAKGVFVSLDDFYESVTYLDPRPGFDFAAGRVAAPLDLSRRRVLG